jgi:hypothetical protein
MPSKMHLGPQAPISSLRRRQQQKPKVAGTSIVVGIAILLVGFLWVLGVAIFSLSLGDRSETQRPLDDRIFPGLSIDTENLWPDDRTNLEFRNSLQSCTETKDENNCRQRLQPGSLQHHVAIVRPPGVFGGIMEDYVAQIVEKHDNGVDETTIILLPTSHIGLQHNYTKVVRVATLPVLLEAVDLALVTTDSGFTFDRITRDDILTVVRQLVAWHCRLSAIASDTALTTLHFARTMASPTRVAESLTGFLSLNTPADDDEEGIDMETNAQEILVRIDEISSLVRSLDGSLSEDADRIIQEELQRESCRSTIFPGNYSRVVYIVGHLLDANSESGKHICLQYPLIPYCEQEDVANK